MTVDVLPMTAALHTYMLSVSLREPALLQRLRAETVRLPGAGMLLAPEQGQFLSLLTRLIGARRTLEVGVFTGYSSLWIALALPDDGEMIACDVSETWTAVARQYWQEAGVDHKIDLQLRPAAETLQALLDAGRQEQFDLAFIDADKSNYLTYYEQCLPLVRRGGLIIFDNVLWDGKVAEPDARDDHTEAIRAVNKFVHEDQRVDMSLVPIGDGLLLAQRR